MPQRYIFVNCIADGPVNFKASLLAPGQPGIREAFMIVTEGGTDNILSEHDGQESGSLRVYGEMIASGAIVVGHSVEYHHGHIRAELIRRGTDPCDGRVKTICTMLGLTGHVTKRNGKRGWPTFEEACDHFQITRAGTESAFDNVMCLVQVMRGIEAAGIHLEARIWKERH